jgi:hypothetical protein
MFACALDQVGGGPAVATAVTSNPSTDRETKTVSTSPSARHESSAAPLARATIAARSHGTPLARPTAVSAAAIAAASAAPATDARAASTPYKGRTRAVSATVAATIPTASTEPAPPSRSPRLPSTCARISDHRRGRNFRHSIARGTARQEFLAIARPTSHTPVLLAATLTSEHRRKSRSHRLPSLVPAMHPQRRPAAALVALPLVLP